MKKYFPFSTVPYQKQKNSRTNNKVCTVLSKIRTKGMGEIFHGQTKGYMFACD